MGVDTEINAKPAQAEAKVGAELGINKMIEDRVLLHALPKT